jgi:hypothetical protein
MARQRWSSFLSRLLLQGLVRQNGRGGESGLCDMVEYPDECDEDDGGSSTSGEMESPVDSPLHKSMMAGLSDGPSPWWWSSSVLLASILSILLRSRVEV